MMFSLEQLQLRFNTHLQASAFKGKPNELYDPINYIMQLGGKRFRPLMVLMGCNLYSEHIDEALDAALAIEVFHNFTLVHDDIMDQAPIRRGQQTVHLKWDLPTAILSGDLMMIQSVELLGKTRHDQHDRILKMFTTTARQVCEGQQLDMLFERRQQVSIDEYIDMIALKTSVLLGCSLYIGSLIGGAPENDAEHIYEFAKNLGIAFQLHDDILDAYAADENFGKQNGGDILANKKTYLLLMALQMAKGDTQVALNSWLESVDFSPEEKVKAVLEIYNQLGVRKLAEQEQEKYFRLALSHLPKLELSETKKQYLGNFAELVMSRSH